MNGVTRKWGEKSGRAQFHYSLAGVGGAGVGGRGQGLGGLLTLPSYSCTLDTNNLPGKKGEKKKRKKRTATPATAVVIPCRRLNPVDDYCSCCY